MVSVRLLWSLYFFSGVHGFHFFFSVFMVSMDSIHVFCGFGGFHGFHWLCAVYVVSLVFHAISYGFDNESPVSMLRMGRALGCAPKIFFVCTTCAYARLVSGFHGFHTVSMVDMLSIVSIWFPWFLYRVSGFYGFLGFHGFHGFMVSWFLWFLYFLHDFEGFHGVHGLCSLYAVSMVSLCGPNVSIMCLRFSHDARYSADTDLYSDTVCSTASAVSRRAQSPGVFNLRWTGRDMNVIAPPHPTHPPVNAEHRVQESSTWDERDVTWTFLLHLTPPIPPWMQSIEPESEVQVNQNPSRKWPLRVASEPEVQVNQNPSRKWPLCPSGAPNHLKNTVFRDFPTFSRICIFFLLTLLSSNLSLLSASSLLCFSSVHIVGSLTSKLPSITVKYTVDIIYMNLEMEI